MNNKNKEEHFEFSQGYKLHALFIFILWLYYSIAFPDLLKIFKPLSLCIKGKTRFLNNFYFLFTVSKQCRCIQTFIRI